MVRQPGLHLMYISKSETPPKEFNAKTAAQAGMIIPVVLTVYQDRSFTFITKTPPVSILLKKAVGVELGSGEPNKTKVAKISKDKVKEIAEIAEKLTFNAEGMADDEVYACVMGASILLNKAVQVILENQPQLKEYFNKE